MSEVGLELVYCPELREDDTRCGLPAEILDRQVLGSTAEPVEHIKTRCIGKHFLFFPVSMLEQD